MTPSQCLSQKQSVLNVVILMHTIGQYRHGVVMKGQQSSIDVPAANTLGAIMVDNLLTIKRLTHL